MKNLIVKLLKAASLVLAGLVIGLIVGLRAGQPAAFYIDAAPRGFMAVAYLNQMEKGRDAYIARALEDDVDQALYYSSLLPEQWWYPAYEVKILGGASSQQMNEYIVAAANYRRGHPREEDPAMFDVVPEGKEEYAEFYAELAVSHRDRQRRIQEMVRSHASM